MGMMRRILALEQALECFPTPEPMAADTWRMVKDFGVPRDRVEELWLRHMSFIDPKYPTASFGSFVRSLQQEPGYVAPEQRQDT